jgi:hypothetical protein
MMLTTAAAIACVAVKHPHTPTQAIHANYMANFVPLSAFRPTGIFHHQRPAGIGAPQAAQRL